MNIRPTLRLCRNFSVYILRLKDVRTPGKSMDAQTSEFLRSKSTDRRPLSYARRSEYATEFEFTVKTMRRKPASN